MESTRSLQHILLIDDNPNDRLLAIREIRQAFPQIKIREVGTEQQLAAALAEDGFDLVITDYDLRWSTGIEVLRTIRQKHGDLPVIMFTDSGTQEVAVEAMKAGLDDYVLKSPKHLIRLQQAVRSVWQNAQVRQRATELETRLQFLLDELKVGVFRANLNGQLLEVSEGLLQLMGVQNVAEAEAFFRQNLLIAPYQNDAPQPWHREVQISDAQGQPRWIQISEMRVGVDEDGLVDGLVIDITKQKETSAALRSLNQTLEQRVAQRTERLESLNNELEMFAFSISHDLRSPIRQIDGFASFLEQKIGAVSDVDALTGDAEDENSAAHFIRRIRQLTDRAGRMIDDLLQFSRTGRAKMYYTEVSMERLVQEVMRQVEPQLKSRQVRWHIEPMPVVHGDRTLLRQVWQNLIENALKYTRPRSVAEIAIGSDQREDVTIFFVKDNGIGFEPQNTDRMFSIFQRLPNAENFDGTGIGLANTRRIIHRHQGCIWAEGALDAGATFYFSLPRSNQE